jgi:hypothetical protein
MIRQVAKAVKALLAYVNKTKSESKSKDLLDDAITVWLIVGTKKMPDSHSVKPLRMYVSSGFDSECFLLGC